MPEDTTTTANTTPSADGPVVGSSQQGSGELAAELARLREETATLRRERDAAQAKKDAKIKKAADDAALKAGEHERLLGERNAELEAQAKRIKEFEDAAKARVDAMIAKLPETTQGELKLISDALTLDRLEAFVAAKLENVDSAPNTPDGTIEPRKKAPPPAHVSPRSTKAGEDHVHPETKMLLRRLSAPHTVEQMANHVHGVPMQPRNPGDPEQQHMVGDHRFRLHGHRGEGTIEEINEHDTAVWIDNLRAISPPPRQREQLLAMERMDAAAKDRA